jgi:tRNA-dihydrouridine synthase
VAINISLAPIQGITDYHFRNAFNKHFGGVDTYFAPYLRIDKKQAFKISKLKDILPENNNALKLIPQIMTNNSEDFIFMANELANLGYEELNWNLGCPYPMVTNRQLGAGLLPHHLTITDILEKSLSTIKTKVSIKMRTGLINDTEIEQLLPKLDPYPLTEIIIHPRYAKQLYKENANIDLFEKCLTLTKHLISYNGDITSLQLFKKYATRFQSINKYMIGRGLISNPFLAIQIKNNSNKLAGNEALTFNAFHDELFDSYLNTLSGASHVLPRMKAFWEYFSLSFSDSHKAFKKIKKASNLNKYKSAVNEIIQEYSWLNLV